MIRTSREKDVANYKGCAGKVQVGGCEADAWIKAG
jgi:hypothetical protein